MRWDTTLLLGWILFGGWILAIEFIELSRTKNAVLGYRHTVKGRRRTDYLFVATGFWMFVIAVILLWGSS